MIFVILLLILALAVYIYHVIRFSYWKRRGVPNPKPYFLVGNIFEAFIGRKSLPEVVRDIYDEYQGYPFVGYFKATIPVLIVRDPEFIKAITVKDFQHFIDNEVSVDKNVDPILSKNPFFAKGQEWKMSRSEVTPCFTSGKMKFVYPMLLNVNKEMVSFLDTNIENAGGKATLEMKELCSKYTIDNVSICAFGVEGKCFRESNPKMRDLARRFLTPGTYSAFAMAVLMAFPKLQYYLPIKFLQKDVEEEIVALVGATIRYRKEHGIVRNDFLDMIGQLKETCTAYKFTDIDVAAHMGGFFVDGFETSSGVMSFVLFELANNRDAQTRLRDEVEEVFEKNKGELSYDVLNTEMPYMDAVLEESLRKNIILPTLNKVCTKKYTYHSPARDDFKEMSVTIDEGTVLSIPAYALAHDPTFFEDPEKFDPDRFLVDKNRYRYISLPFGEGPRACLGRRFGLLQIKVGLAFIIKNYELRVSSKTKLPLTYDPMHILLCPKGGLWVDMYKVKK